MPIPESKERVMLTIAKEELKRVDRLCERFNLTRSDVYSISFEQAEETLQMLDMLHLSPENIRAIAKAVSMGVKSVVEPLAKKAAARA